MKKRIIALFVLIALCLSSCSQEKESDVSADIAPEIRMRAEIPEKIKYGEAFEVRVGFYFPNIRRTKEATIGVIAENYDIILADGSIHRDFYAFEYSDYTTDLEYDSYHYYESFSLVYTGPDNYVGHVNFYVRANKYDEIRGKVTMGNSITVFYKVRWKYIRWNIERPRNYTKDFYG
jgi:hypothetical protein